jgi:hypothetical protein
VHASEAPAVVTVEKPVRREVTTLDLPANMKCSRVREEDLPESKFECEGDSLETRRCVFHDVLFIDQEVGL